jgi:TolA-binding protein
MPMNGLKHTIITAFIIFVSFSAFAQETEVYTERNVHIKKGMEHMELKNYQSAQTEFELAANEAKLKLANHQVVLSDIAEYYYAYCAYKMDMPNTELLYLNYIKNHHETPYRRKAYFDLGNYYFEHKKTTDAMKWYEKVDRSDLSNEDLLQYKFNMAYTYFKKKKFKEAKPLFAAIKNAKNQYQEPATYYYGFISFYDKKYNDAQKSFEKLKNSKLYQNVVPYYLVQIYYMQGNYQKTVDYAQPLLDNPKTKNRKELNHIVGQAYFESGQYEQSIPLLKNYIDNTRKVSKEEMFQLAYAQYKTGQYAEAIENLQPLSVVKGALGQNAMYLLGNAYLETGNKSMARDAYQAAIDDELDPEMTEVSSFQFAKLSYELDYYSIAINSLTAFIKKYPSSEYKAEALSLVSNVLLKTKNYARAIEVIENNNISGPKIEATYQKVCLYRAVELYNDGQDNDALVLADKSMKNNVDQDLKAQAVFLKGLVFYNQKKYDDAVKAFAWYKQFDTDAGDWNSKTLANYNLAYCYFKTKKYAKASTYFEKSLDQFSLNQKGLIIDANLRNADCLLMSRNYDRALTFYDKVIDNNWSAKEYALLQKSVIYGLQGNFNAKISTLESLLRNNPTSTYADQSQFEISDANLQLGNIQTAIAGFNKFTSKYPNSKFMPEAYLKLGLLFSNAGKDNKSLEAYKKVVIKYPNSEEAKEALIALKELYVAMGRPNDYIKFVENEVGISVSVNEQEKIMFQSAEEKYISGDCSKTVEITTDYISLFPNGASVLDVQYFRADCSFKAKNFNQAFIDYKAVAGKGLSKYIEESLLKATFIAYEKNKNYQEANALYNDLYTYASLQSNKEIAQIGLMRTYFRLGSQTEVLRYANDVLNDDNISQDVKQEATFYKAKALFETGKFNQAKVVFEEVIEQQATSKIKAESAYHVALIKNKNNDFEGSKADCFFIKNEYASYTYWVVKTFILLADNYDALDNIFQAKATLKSILDNYTGDQALIDEAQLKYDALVAKELIDSKIDLNDDSQDELEFDGE